MIISNVSSFALNAEKLLYTVLCRPVMSPKMTHLGHLLEQLTVSMLVRIHAHGSSSLGHPHHRSGRGHRWLLGRHSRRFCPCATSNASQLIKWSWASVRLSRCASPLATSYTFAPSRGWCLRGPNVIDGLISLSSVQLSYSRCKVAWFVEVSGVNAPIHHI